MLDITDKAVEIAVNVASKLLKGFTGIDKILKGDEFLKYFNIAFAKSDHKDLPTVLDELAEGLGAITLVVDEANISLTISETTSNDEVKSTKQTLALFTRLTKQTNKVTIP
jgi:hypothetical protein